MESRWSDADAEAMVERYRQQDVNADRALRVYTSRLLGGDPALVLHGGGNTSVKTRMPDLLGDEVDVLCVKGSGWDMAEIEPAGLPAVRLEPLRKLMDLAALSDEDMVNAQRCNLLDSSSPRGARVAVRVRPVICVSGERGGPLTSDDRLVAKDVPSQSGSRSWVSSPSFAGNTHLQRVLCHTRGGNAG